LKYCVKGCNPFKNKDEFFVIIHNPSSFVSKELVKIPLEGQDYKLNKFNGTEFLPQYFEILEFMHLNYTEHILFAEINVDPDDYVVLKI
jgi:hypothetical protein